MKPSAPTPQPRTVEELEKLLKLQEIRYRQVQNEIDIVKEENAENIRRNMELLDELNALKDGLERRVEEKTRSLDESNRLLMKRDVFLQSAARTGAMLLSDMKIEEAISSALKTLGKASCADKTFIATGEGLGGRSAECFVERFSWSKEGVEPGCFPGTESDPDRYDDYPGWLDLLSKGLGMFCLSSGKEEAPLLRCPPGAKMAMLAPICVRGVYWGFLGFVSIDGKRGWGEAELSILSTVASIIGGVVERRRYEDELKAAAESSRLLAIKAESANMMKSDFLASMSHDIRTPMNGITGMTDLLLRSQLNADQRDWAETIAYSGQILMSLVDDILDLSKIEAGQMRLEVLPFDLKLLLERLIAVLKPKAEQKGIALKLDYQEEAPIHFMGDPTRIRQIAMNLAGNALKFTECGSVSIKVSVEATGPASAMAVVEVSDTGIGIPEDKLDDIFEKFRQADSSITRKYGGSGLGLSICKSLVELMGGHIEVKSVHGKGSVFNFRLPLDLAVGDLQPESESDGQAPHEEIELRPDVKILLADDNNVNRKVARALLKRLGGAPDEAVNGEEVLRMASGKSYDLIFMDCQMPVMDGYEATRRLRLAERGSGRHIAIVAMTANAMSQDREDCLKAGMDDFIAKPVSYKDLESLLSKHVGLIRVAGSSPARAEKAAASQAAWTPSVDRDVLDIDFLISNVGGCKDILMEIAEALPKEFGDKAALISQGAADNDFSVVRANAHSLKGSASVVGANQLSRLARLIDQDAKESRPKISMGNVEELKKELERFIEILSRIDWDRELALWSERHPDEAGLQ